MFVCAYCLFYHIPLMWPPGAIRLAESTAPGISTLTITPARDETKQWLTDKLNARAIRVPRIAKLESGTTVGSLWWKHILIENNDVALDLAKLLFDGLRSKDQNILYLVGEAIMQSPDVMTDSDAKSG